MKDKLLKKIVKKNYNNQLEEVLTKKEYPLEVKNELLSIFYKIENGYNDYKTIKRQTFEKKEYIEKLISIIEKDCDKIEFTKNKEKEKVDKKNKQIICYPIETNILYSIAKIQKGKTAVSYLDNTIEKALTFLLNTGNNINMVEPLRDFNGFSWNVIVKDIEDVNCNLIYQNMIYMLGNKFIDKWVNNYDQMVDYFELFEEEIKQNYSEEIEEKITTNIINIAILTKIEYDKNFKNEIKEKFEENETKYSEFENTSMYISKISRYKKQIETKIKNIDKIIYNKELLIQEYEQRNKDLPLEKKIFSIRVLKNLLIEERINLLEEIQNQNKLIDPQYFIREKDLTKTKLKYFSIVEKEDIKKELNKNLINLQKEIIKCMYLDTKKIKTKQDLIEQIYKYRYYSLLPINEEELICNKKELSSYLNKLTKAIIEKAIKMKVINKIINIEEINFEITKKLLLSKIVSLQDINIKPNYKDGNLMLTIYDEEIEDNKINIQIIQKKELNMKLNKKIKLFN